MLYGFELSYGVLLLRAPNDPLPIYNIATILVVIYFLGLLRAWQLLGAPRFGISDWLNPLNDVKDGEAMTKSDSSNTANKTVVDGRT